MNNVTTFMSIGYTFKNFLEMSRPLKSKLICLGMLPTLAPLGNWKKQKIKIKNCSQHDKQNKQTNDLPQNIDIEGHSNIQRYWKESSKK